MRAWLAALFATFTLQAGCSSGSRPLACADTVARACATAGSCPLTWDEAQADPTFCAGATETSPLRSDCGPYHAVTVKIGTDSRTFYYEAGIDAASGGSGGMLIAIVTAHGGSATTTCDAGPAAGFTPPACSAGSQLLPQCLDGGVDTGAAP